MTIRSPINKTFVVCKIATDRNQLTTDRNQLTTRNSQLATDRNQLTTRNLQLATDNSQLTTRNWQLRIPRGSVDGKCSFCGKVQLIDLRGFYGRSRHASCTWCNLLSGELGPDIRQYGGAGPHTVSGRSLVLQYVEEMVPTTYLCLFVIKESWFLCCNKYPTKEVKKTIIAFWWQIKIRIYSVERYEKFSYGKAKIPSLWGECTVRALAARTLWAFLYSRFFTSRSKAINLWNTEYYSVHVITTSS